MDELELTNLLVSLVGAVPEDLDEAVRLIKEQCRDSARTVVDEWLRTEPLESANAAYVAGQLYEVTLDELLSRANLVSPELRVKFMKDFQIRLYDPGGNSIGNAPYRISIEGRVQGPSVADSQGYVNLRNVEVPTKCTLEWGIPDPAADPKQPPVYLFKLDMNFLCKAEGSSESLRLTKDDFLGRGADKQGKGDYQGCGEFNPVLVFSKDEDRQFQKPEMKKKRDVENQIGRAHV